MKTPILSICLFFIVTALHAQISAVTTSPTGSGSSGSGTRIMWYPAKGAFRSGTASGTSWDDANVGNNSVAFGTNNIVGGVGGFAFGTNNTISSTATNGFVTGDSNNVGSNSFGTTIFGQGNISSYSNSNLLIGWNNVDYGTLAGLISGFGNTAAGSSTVALGSGNNVSGWGAATIGLTLTTGVQGCVVVGMGNVSIPGNANAWRGTDPVFIVGNGTAGNTATGETGPTLSNALVVYKNGIVNIPKRQGDILMGVFGNPGSND